MAIYAVLRRATSTVLPLALRRATSSALPLASRSALTSSSRTFHSFLTGRFGNVELSHVARKSFATKTSADDNLTQVLDSEINCALEDDDAQREFLSYMLGRPDTGTVPASHIDMEHDINRKSKIEIPDDFPFEIEDNPGERTIQLKRQYQGETIKVEVDIPNVGPEENKGDDDGDDDSEKDDFETSIPLVVSVFKQKSGVTLEFGVTAFPDEISIDSLSVKQPEESEEQLAYEGPEFNDLDENLQKAFEKYLEIRGIKPSTTNFLQEYMFSKDHKEYLQWLKNLKNFVEE